MFTQAGTLAGGEHLLGESNKLGLEWFFFPELVNPPGGVRVAGGNMKLYLTQ